MAENQERALEQADINRRLEAGEELEFGEVAMAFSVRPGECWKFAGYGGRGRSPDPHSPHSEIPHTAWLHLRWRSCEADVVLEAPSGTRIYDVRVRSPVAATDPDQPAQSVQVAGAPLEPSAAFDAIAVADLSGDAPWSLERYRAVLATSGLSLTTDKLRVPGVTITIGGKIERGGGPTLLRNALLVCRFCSEEKQAQFAGAPRAEVARSLVAWLIADHPDLVPPSSRIGPNLPHEVARLLRDLGLHGSRDD